MEIFQDYAYYYNAFYKDKDYKKEAQDIKKLIEMADPKIRSMINFGCGTGKHDIELAQLGFDMEGIDLSEDMIRIAREKSSEKGLDIPFSVHNVCDFKPQKKYDAVISLFHVMSYQNSNEQIVNAFKSARSCLEKGGTFLFDAWYGPGVLTDRPAVRTKQVEDEKYRLVRLANPVMYDERNIVDVNYEVLVIDKETNVARTIKETHSMRYFFRPEIEMYLSLAGFELTGSYDCGTLGKTGYDSWTCYFTARAV